MKRKSVRPAKAAAKAKPKAKFDPNNQPGPLDRKLSAATRARLEHKRGLGLREKRVAPKAKAPRQGVNLTGDGRARPLTKDF